MKSIIFLILATVTMSCNSQEFSEKALSTTLLSLDGSQIAFKEILKKHEGKTVLIEVWAAWCSDCVKNMPKIKEIQKNNPNVDYVFLSADKTAESWKKGMEKHNVIGDNYMINDGNKGEFAKTIDLDWIPRYIIIDKTGAIITYKAIETDFEKVNETLQKLK